MQGLLGMLRILQIYLKGCMKKRVLVVSLVTGVLVTGIAFAYFFSRVQLILGRFNTSQLQINLEALSDQNPYTILPGQSQELEWKAINTGTTPVYVKGKIIASFSQPELDNSMLEVLTIWRKDELGHWHELIRSGTDLNEFYYSDNGTEANLITLNEGEEQLFKVLIKLKEEASNEYQNIIFTADTLMVAKQTVESAPWPEFDQ